jgi:hypothetical protein
LICTSGPAAAGTAENFSVPMHFIRNQGQVDDRVAFYERSGGHTTFFTKDAVVMALREPDAAPPTAGTDGTLDVISGEAWFSYRIVRPRPKYMHPDSRIVPDEPLPARVNHFIGNDPEKWHTDVPAYGTVVYRSAWPGMDLRFYGRGSDLELDIIVKPWGGPGPCPALLHGRCNRFSEPGGPAGAADSGRFVHCAARSLHPQHLPGHARPARGAVRAIHRLAAFRGGRG